MSKRENELTCGWQNQFNYLSPLWSTFTAFTRTNFTLPSSSFSVCGVGERMKENFSGKKKTSSRHSLTQPLWRRRKSVECMEIFCTCISCTHQLPQDISQPTLPSSTNDSCGLLHVLSLTSSSWWHRRVSTLCSSSSPCHSFSFMYMNMNDMFSMLLSSSSSSFYDNSFLWCFIILTLSYHKVIHGKASMLLRYQDGFMMFKKNCAREKERD